MWKTVICGNESKYEIRRLNLALFQPFLIARESFTCNDDAVLEFPPYAVHGSPTSRACVPLAQRSMAWASSQSLS